MLIGTKNHHASMIISDTFFLAILRNYCISLFHSFFLDDLIYVVIFFFNVGFNLLDDLLKMHEAGLLAFKVLKQRRICLLEELILVARNVFRFELMQLILDFLYAILQLVILVEERRVHVMVV